MKHLKQMNFTLFKELFNLSDGCRKVNEDIAALRNIAWAIFENDRLNNVAAAVLSSTELLLVSSNDRDIDVAYGIHNLLTIT